MTAEIAVSTIMTASKRRCATRCTSHKPRNAPPITAGTIKTLKVRDARLNRRYQEVNRDLGHIDHQEKPRAGGNKLFLGQLAAEKIHVHDRSSRICDRTGKAGHNPVKRSAP